MTSDSDASPSASSESPNSAITTAVIFGLISIFVYYVFLKPLFSSEQGAGAGTGAATQRQQLRQQQQQQRRQIPSNTNQQPNTARTTPTATATSTSSSSLSSSWTRQYQTRQPPHATKSDAAIVLDSSGGLISFRHTTAANYEVATAKLDPETIAANRKERARVLSRILAMESSSSSSSSSTTMASPPPRGVTAVVSIPTDDLECPTLRRILYLLGTYFNLIVVLSIVTTTDNDTATSTAATDTATESNTAKRQSDQIKAYIQTLRGTATADTDDPAAFGLPHQVLPDHRIVVAQSTTGRIALVRQLERVAFVLDYEPQIKQELERFGFKVLVYGGEDNKHTTTTTTTSTSSTTTSSNNNNKTSRLATRLMLAE